VTPSSEVANGVGNQTAKSDTRYFFMPIQDLPDVPEEDVVTICRRHMSTLLHLIFDAMTEFKYALDDRWYFTEENFRKMGKSFNDAVLELGFLRNGLMRRAR